MQRIGCQCVANVIHLRERTQDPHHTSGSLKHLILGQPNMQLRTSSVDHGIATLSYRPNTLVSSFSSNQSYILIPSYHPCTVSYRPNTLVSSFSSNQSYILIPSYHPCPVSYRPNTLVSSLPPINLASSYRLTTLVPSHIGLIPSYHHFPPINLTSSYRLTTFLPSF